jgi:hypothetical protein
VQYALAFIKHQPKQTKGEFNMKIQYTIKGVTLDDIDLMECHQYYEAACTAEYLMENYDIDDESTAMHLGYEVRRLMDKYGYDEEEAIYEVLRTMKGE